MRRPPIAAAVALAVALSTAACSDGDRSGADTTTTTSSTSTTTTSSTVPTSTTTTIPPPPTQAQLDAVAVRWEQVGTASFPTALAARPPTGVLYVGERLGTVRLLRDGAAVDPPVLDLREEVAARGEGGFLGLAFSADGGTLVVSYTDKSDDSRVVAFTMSGDGVDPASRRELLHVEQPTTLHKGGHVAFDRDGFLWISLGDGGRRTPEGREVAQRTDNFFGKLLRLDLRTPGAQPEIVAYGLRNPWRFSFDRATGEVWIGDVGEHGAEEINHMGLGERGVNYGWPRFEGTRRFTGPVPANHRPPVKAYTHDGTVCAVTAGYVYRGTAVPGLVGAFLYTDLCTGHVLALSPSGGRVVAERDFGRLSDQVVSFGEGVDGELYATSLVGQVWKLVPG